MGKEIDFKTALGPPLRMTMARGFCSDTLYMPCAAANIGSIEFIERVTNNEGGRKHPGSLLCDAQIERCIARMRYSYNRLSFNSKLSSCLTRISLPLQFMLLLHLRPSHCPQKSTARAEVTGRPLPLAKSGLTTMSMQSGHGLHAF